MPSKNAISQLRFQDWPPFLGTANVIFPQLHSSTSLHTTGLFPPPGFPALAFLVEALQLLGQ